MNTHVAVPGRPTARFMLSHPAHLVALGFGSGLAAVAPGTFGTLWGWISYLAMDAWLTPGQRGAVILLSLPLGWWACTVTARKLQVMDPTHVVWDEIVAFWIILALVMPASWLDQLAAFALFRVFDALKPGPIGWVDQAFKGFGWRGGFGIFADDLAAALCTLLVIAFWRQLW